MANEVIQARVSPGLKADAEAVFSSMGLTLAEGIRLFLQQSVNMGGLPFQPQGKRPNAQTLAAMEELERGGGTVYHSVDALFDSLDDDD